MQIRLINKGDLNTVSGGYLFNKQVFEGLEKRGYSIEYTSQFSPQKNAIDIVDSLVMMDYMDCHTDFSHALVLIHQIPSKFNINHQKVHQLKFVVTGEQVKQELINNWKILPRKVQVVEPGIESDWIVKKHHRKHPENILMVANYLPEKGHQLLLSILKEIKDVDWNLTVYGNKNLDQNYYNHLLESVNNSAFQSRIKLNATIDRAELNKAYINADVLLHCSEKETYGMAIAEAIKTKLPCIIYKTGNWQAFEQSGWVKIVHSYHPAAFARELRDFLLNPASFLKFSPQKKNTMGRTWKDVIDDIEMLLPER